MLVATIPLRFTSLARSFHRRIAVRQGALLGTSFHPEVTGETRFHELFLRAVRSAA